jgi:hypothetical protein
MPAIFSIKLVPFKGGMKRPVILLFWLAWMQFNILDYRLSTGTVDKENLSETIYCSANPLDMAFRSCAQNVELWFIENAPDELGVLIADDTNEGEKRNLKGVFWQYRGRFTYPDMHRRKLGHLIDDMYFGDSKDSLGIQIADVCGFFISRHLNGYDDLNRFYPIIKDRVWKYETVP